MNHQRLALARIPASVLGMLERDCPELKWSEAQQYYAVMRQHGEDIYYLSTDINRLTNEENEE